MCFVFSFSHAIAVLETDSMLSSLLCPCPTGRCDCVLENLFSALKGCLFHWGDALFFRSTPLCWTYLLILVLQCLKDGVSDLMIALARYSILYPICPLLSTWIPSSRASSSLPFLHLPILMNRNPCLHWRGRTVDPITKHLASNISKTMNIIMIYY